MRAMVLNRPHGGLILTELEQPQPASQQVLLRVHACGVCRTDLHVVDGKLTGGKLPIIPGHEIVGSVVAAGTAVTHFKAGDRVGVPWLGYACGKCAYCASGRENLCNEARFTGYHLDGGYAEYALADQRYCFALPAAYSDAGAAPLLCAGLIGYRALVMAGDAKRLGIYGFGAAAHIVAQVARFQGRQFFAFTRSGDAAGKRFAHELDAAWAGDSDALPPEPLDAAIIFAPVGTVVCAGIHMSDIPAFPYAILWGERSIRSVANLTRRDGEEFLRIAPQVPVRTAVETFELAQANEALTPAARRAHHRRGGAGAVKTTVASYGFRVSGFGFRVRIQAVHAQYQTRNLKLSVPGKNDIERRLVIS